MTRLRFIQRSSIIPFKPLDFLEIELGTAVDEVGIFHVPWTVVFACLPVESEFSTTAFVAVGYSSELFSISTSLNKLCFGTTFCLIVFC